MNKNKTKHKTQNSKLKTQKQFLLKYIILSIYYNEIYSNWW